MNDVIINVKKARTFEDIGIIDEYIEIKRTDNFFGHSFLELTLPLTEQNLKLFSFDKTTLEEYMNIIIVSDEREKAYYTEIPQLFLGKEPYIYVMCYSLSSLLSHRVNPYVMEYYEIDYGNIAATLVERNAILSTNSKRNIPSLRIYNRELGIEYTGITVAGKKVDTHIEILLNNIGATYDIFFDNENNDIYFKSFLGNDRTDKSTTNLPIIFSEESDNILSAEYTDDKSGLYNAYLTYGSGESKDFYLFDTINNSGWNRREAYIEANDIKQKYTNENNVEIVLTDAQFIATLNSNANTELLQFKRINNIVVEVNDYGQYVYLRDYFLGDFVTVKLPVVNQNFDFQIGRVTTTYNSKGKSVQLELGEAKPSYLQAIRKGLNNGIKR